MLYTDVGDAMLVSADLAEAKAQAAATLAIGTGVSTLVLGPAEYMEALSASGDRKEIVYRGHLYDVASVTSTATEVFLKLRPDEKEENLLKRLGHLVENWTIGSDRNDPKWPKTKHHPIIKDFFPPVNVRYFSSLLLREGVCLEKSGKLSFPALAVLKSPPKPA